NAALGNGRRDAGQTNVSSTKNHNGGDLPSPDRKSSTQFPGGKVVARVLTDDAGRFDFPNLKPGAYQLRAQVLGGVAWCDAGRIFFASSGLRAEEVARLKEIEFRLAPFKKGHWTVYDYRNGLPSTHVRKLWVDPEGVLWVATMGGVSRFDGNQFVNLT